MTLESNEAHFPGFDQLITNTYDKGVAVTHVDEEQLPELLDAITVATNDRRKDHLERIGQRFSDHYMARYSAREHGFSLEDDYFEPATDAGDFGMAAMYVREGTGTLEAIKGSHATREEINPGSAVLFAPEPADTTCWYRIVGNGSMKVIWLDDPRRHDYNEAILDSARARRANAEYLGSLSKKAARKFRRHIK